MPNFLDTQSKIETFLASQKEGFYDIHERSEKLPVSDSIFCAEDRVRNRAFREAIKDAILIQKRKKAEVIVVDA
jgi:hypothetical protein